MTSQSKKETVTAAWFRELRDRICSEFEAIEEEYLAKYPQGFSRLQNSAPFYDKPQKFARKNWHRQALEGSSGEGGGGEMSVMKGNVFEKVGVNISTTFGAFSDEFRGQIPGTETSPNYFATGISLVAHMASPLVPAAHFNTRFINTQKEWFGGGGDLNPMIENADDTRDFHDAFKKACDAYDAKSYEEYKAQCDKYFFIKHRGVARGVGGIFYDYLNSENFEKDFDFTKNVGLAFLEVFPKLVRKHMFEPYSEEQREHQFKKRGLYTEFNLVYDRGTKFGLMTGGNTEAILMSLPPIAKWD